MTTTIKLFFSSCFLLLLTTLAHAQVGIGTSVVNTSARLQIDATNKGFLPPRVTLTGTSDVSTISSPATGLLVYNTATAGTSPSNVTPGFYYYDGAKWQRIISQQPDATISFNQNTPTTGGVVFTPNTPNSTDYIYVSSTNNSQWTYNGSAYVTFTPPASTPWILSGGTTDAGSNKSDAVYRTGSVGIGSTTIPNASAQLDVNSTSKGFLPPRMTTTQRDAIASAADGLIIYNTTNNMLEIRSSSAWLTLTTLTGTETITNKTLTTPNIASGSDQWASSISISPSTHATSRRASVWIDGWGLLQDNNGNGTKDFSIYQSAASSSRLTINTSGNIGIGNNAPNARLDIRTSPTSISDPGTGYLGIGTTTTAANTAGAGAIRYSTSSGGTLEYSNGSNWNTLQSNVQKAVVSGYLDAATYANSFYGDLAATETLDIGGSGANGSFQNSTFTAPRTGNYTFSVTLSSDNTGGAIANGTWEVQVVPSVGDQMISRFMVPAVASGYIATVSGAYTVQLSAGTTVKFKIYNSLGISKTLASAIYNRFSIAEN